MFQPDERSVEDASRVEVSASTWQDLPGEAKHSTAQTENEGSKLMGDGDYFSRT